MKLESTHFIGFDRAVASQAGNDRFPSLSGVRALTLCVLAHAKAHAETRPGSRHYGLHHRFNLHNNLLH